MYKNASLEVSKSAYGLWGISINIMRYLYLVVLGVILSGCVSKGPTSGVRLHDSIVQALPVGTTKPDILSSGTWFPNSQGYGFLNSRAAATQTGAIAITDENLYFLQWSASQKQMNIMRVVPYLSAKQVFVDRFGRGRMLVIQNSDLSFDSFEFTKTSGTWIDKEMTERAFLAISKRRDGR